MNAQPGRDHALTAAPDGADCAEVYRFRLYIAADALNSAQAASNLAAICTAHLPGRHHIEVIDVLSDPLRALRDGVFMTPTLVKQGPPPQRRIVGSLSQTQTVLLALGLGPRDP